MSAAILQWRRRLELSCPSFSLAHVLPKITEEEGLMAYTAANHQEAAEIFWLHFCCPFLYTAAPPLIPSHCHRIPMITWLYLNHNGSRDQLLLIIYLPRKLWSQHSSVSSELSLRSKLQSKRFRKLFLNGIYCMTRIFNTDTVNEMLFNCVAVWVLACPPLGAMPACLQDMEAYLLVIAHFHLLWRSRCELMLIHWVT